MQGSSSLIMLSPGSPSFNSYSSGKLAEIAARVVQEFTTESDQSDIFSWNLEEDNLCFPGVVECEGILRNGVQGHNHDGVQFQTQGDEDDGDDEFEFVVSCCREIDSLSVSADDIFYNGEIKPIYPLFDTNLLLNQEPSSSTKSDNYVANKPFKPKRPPLRKLFNEENESQHSCSSSEADELEGAAPGSYCAWTPKKELVASGCKKSSSTGSSKRWKFRDLLYRSNSDGKDTFVFLTPSKIKGSTSDQERITGNNSKDKDITEGKAGAEEHYAKNRAIKDGHKRRSFLPYRQDLVGILSNNTNGVGRNFHPF